MGTRKPAKARAANLPPPPVVRGGAALPTIIPLPPPRDLYEDIVRDKRITKLEQRDTPRPMPPPPPTPVRQEVASPPPAPTPIVVNLPAPPIVPEVPRVPTVVTREEGTQVLQQQISRFEPQPTPAMRPTQRRQESVRENTNAAEIERLYEEETTIRALEEAERRAVMETEDKVRKTDFGEIADATAKRKTIDEELSDAAVADTVGGDQDRSITNVRANRPQGYEGTLQDWRRLVQTTSFRIYGRNYASLTAKERRKVARETKKAYL